MRYFDIAELVCPDVYHHYGNKAWMFFDVRLLITLDTIRERIGKPIYANDWQIHGQYSQRGLRCLRCDLVKLKCEANEIYMSAHLLGKGADFDVLGLEAEEVREWLVKHENLWPYPIRLEKYVSWVHLDTYNISDDKIILFDP